MRIKVSITCLFLHLLPSALTSAASFPASRHGRGHHRPCASLPASRRGARRTCLHRPRAAAHYAASRSSHNRSAGEGSGTGQIKPLPLLGAPQLRLRNRPRRANIVNLPINVLSTLGISSDKNDRHRGIPQIIIPDLCANPLVGLILENISSINRFVDKDIVHLSQHDKCIFMSLILVTKLIKTLCLEAACEAIPVANRPDPGGNRVYMRPNKSMPQSAADHLIQGTLHTPPHQRNHLIDMWRVSQNGVGLPR